MLRIGRMLGCVILVAFLACDNAQVPVGPEVSGPALQILDGAHNGGNEHFFFLPPMVSQPAYSGQFDGTLSPIVQVCELAGASCASPLVAEFGTNTGPGSETVRVVPEDEHYIVNLHSRRFNLQPTKVYRVAVLVAGTELGHADVRVLASPRETATVDNSQFVTLVNGRTLPIKFRIEEGAVPFWLLTGFAHGVAGVAGVGALAVNASDHIFAAVSSGNELGTSGPGVFRSLDNGTSWAQINDGLTVTNLDGITVSALGTILVSAHGGGVWRSTDNGNSWVRTSFPAITSNGMHTFGSSIYVHDGFFCTGLYRSRDDGLTWTAINNGLPTCVNSIGVNQAGHLFAATGTSGLFRSTDDGSSWSAVNNGLPAFIFERLFVAPNGDIYAGSRDAGILRSTDNGDTWASVLNGLPTPGVTVLGINSLGHVFVGPFGAAGVYRSVDDGASWESISSGLSPFGIERMVFQSTGHALVSDALQIWRSAQSTTASTVMAAAQ